MKLKALQMIMLTIFITLTNGEKIEVPDSACMMRRGGWFGTVDETAFAQFCNEETNEILNQYAWVRTDRIISIVRKES